MTEKILKLILTIMVDTCGLDTFQDVVHVAMDSDAEDWKFQGAKYAKAVDDCLQKLLWESVCCAIVYSGPVIASEVEIIIHCAEFEGHLICPILQETDGHSQWTPELSEQIKKTSQQLRFELAEMLEKIAAAYYTGGAVEEVGEHYVFSLCR